jgi:hypothetical protein
MESATRGWLALGAMTAVALTAPGGAAAAFIGLVPQRSCYRSAPRGDPNLEQIFLGGNGFTPNAAAEITLDRRSIGRTTANGAGAIQGVLTLGSLRRERKRLLAATDQANPTNFATLTLRTTGVAVNVTPRRSGPGRRVRVRARGFNDSKRLYAHVRRGRRYRRNVRIGRLRRACHKLDRRRRIFSLGTRAGVYIVQFDGKRRYSARTVPRVRYKVTIFRRLARGALASASGAQSWVRLP